MIQIYSPMIFGIKLEFLFSTSIQEVRTTADWVNNLFVNLYHT